MNNQSWVRRFAPAVVAAFVVFFALGTGAYAYESPSVTEGHPLHFIKNNFEKWEEKFANNSEKQAAFHAKMMERRLGEAKHFGFGSEAAQAKLEAAAEQMGLSADELREEMRDPQTRMEMMERLAQQGFEFAEACQLHNERYGQGQAKGFGMGQRLMREPEGSLKGELPLGPGPLRGQGYGLSQDAQTLREQVFSNAELTEKEKREAFHEGMMQLIQDKVGERPRQNEEALDNN